MSAGERKANDLSPMQKAVATIARLSSRVKELEGAARQPIAIVGLACRTPGADNAEALWELLSEGRSAMREVPPERWDVDRYFDPRPGVAGKSCTRVGGFVDGVDQFDAAFFGISAREAEGMDPQQRLLLECAWHALEDAGLKPSTLKGGRSGVFVGVTATDYGMLQAGPDWQTDVNPYFNTGTPQNVCAGRISYLFGLQGPSMAVDTACSSSLTAIHLACQSLRQEESELAIAGGVNLTLTPLLYSTLSAAGMLSVDGHCKSFDSTADGYARGEGCGLLVLKRLADAHRDGDRVLGVIRGSTLNQDGASSGLTVPNGVAQQKLLRESLERSGIAPSDIDYVEAHGTGTPLGDPIEVKALGQVLGQVEGRLKPLRIGSIKSNIGHLESAAGVISVIKVLLALQHEFLPRTLLVDQLNPQIDWAALNVQPLREGEPWTPRADRLRRAGVSAFGASGSNAHLVIEESLPVAPAAERSAVVPDAVLPLSAQCAASLQHLAANYAKALTGAAADSAAILAANGACRRDALRVRAAVIGSDAAEVEAALTALSQQRSHPALIGPVERHADSRSVFVFGGQGDVAPGMGRSLYATFPVYRDAVDHCARLMGDRLDMPLQAILDPDNAAMPGRASWAQPALFSLQYALVRLWESLGVRPSAVVGHSLGEFAAAVTAGALSLEDGMHAVIERARLMESLTPPGAMRVVLSDIDTVNGVLAQAKARAVDVAVVNGPGNVVLAGLPEHLQQLAGEFEGLGIRTVALSVTHGFHSSVMDPILDQLEAAFSAVLPRPPALPYFSALEGRRLTADDRLDGHYWRRHSREPVLFADAVTALHAAGYRRFIEIGPAATASALVAQIAPDSRCVSSLGDRGPNAFQVAVARLWCDGQAVDWREFPDYRHSPRTALPLYPFNRQRYWIKSPEHGAHKQPKVSSEMNAIAPPKPDLDAVLSGLVDIFSDLLRLPASAIDPAAQLIEAGADSLVLVSGVNAIENRFGVKLEIRQLFEEFTTLEAVARHLVINSPVLASPPADAAEAPEYAAAEATQPLPTPPAYSTGTTAPGTPLSFSPGDDLGQLIAAQTQLMSRHLDLLQAANRGPSPGSAPRPQASAATAPVAHAAPADRRAASPSQSHADRSSPLRALNQPIQPVKSTLSQRQQAHMDALIDRYTRRTAESKRLAQGCRPLLADSRASVGFRFSTKEILYPITGVESSGSHVRDVDGNDYVDLTMGFGVLLFGSRPEHMQGVLEAELQHGYQLGPRSRYMEEIARHFSHLTGHDRVAFTNSGTEAVMTALRLARAATARDKIVIFEGAYNGHSDGTLARRVVGADGSVHAEPVSPGIPQSVADDCLVVEYGTPESLEIIRQHAHQLAAVLVEPVQSRRLELQPVEYLKSLRALTQELDIALVFDEMITGFRVHPGGVQGLWGIKADLATYGKILGGGVAIGAVAGDSRFMDGIDGGVWQYGDNSYPGARRTYFGGTFCQHPLAMAGCLATLRELTARGPELQETLNRRTADFAAELNGFFRSEGLDIEVIYFGSLFTFRFPGNLEIFFYHLLEKGVYIWEWRACFLSTAHTDQDLNHVISAVKETVAEMREGDFLPPAPDKSVSPTSGKADFPLQKAASGAQHASRVAFSLYFFGNYDADYAQGKYDLLVDACRYGDERGYEAIWLPERHFDKFGGFSPNPSVLAAALARETQHIRLRAGSVVLPLHHPVRVAEEWALVDNLSEGRVGIAFAAGWHPNDFALAPENFEHSRDITFRNVEVVRRLWRGESMAFIGGKGQEVDLSIFPRPKQDELPCWLTVVGNPDTYRKAAELGAGILTNLLGQSLEDLASNLSIYREAWLEYGRDPDAMSVVILMHTYLEKEQSSAIETARQPMSDYLMSSLSLFQKMADALPESARDISNASEADKSYVVGKAYERYVVERALIGSPESCEPMVERLLDLGVTEIACFLDFGVDGERVMANLPLVDSLRARFAHTTSSDALPLSDAQRQLWLLAQLDEGGNLAYIDPAVVEWRGAVNEEVLARVLADVQERHESLRMTLSEDGRCLRVHQQPLARLVAHDFRSAEAPVDSAQAWMRQVLAEPMSLSDGPLFQPFLLRIADDRSLMMLHAHHIISDGPSMGVLIREIATLYEARAAGQGAQALPAPYQYRDFVAWQQAAREGDAMSVHRAYWLEVLTPLPYPLELPYDRARPGIKTWEGSRLRVEADAEFTASVERAARSAGVTTYMFLHAAFSALIHRWSGSEDIVLGVASSGRSVPGTESMVGYGVHLLPARTRITASTRVSDHLRAVKAVLLDAYEHQAYPFAWLLDELDLPRDPSRSPLVDVIFNYERLPAVENVGGLEMRPAVAPVSHARVDLTLTVNQIGNSMEWLLDYNTALFEARTLERLLEAFRAYLCGFIENPDCRLSGLPLASQAQSVAELSVSRQAADAVPFVPIHRLIEGQADAVPEAPAVRVLGDPSRTMDFATLNGRANALARQLLELECTHPTRAAILLEHSPELMVALLACLKAGIAYVPLDPAYPGKRLDFLCADAGVGLLITQDTLRGKLSDGSYTICLVDSQTVLSDDTENPTVDHLPQQCAYILYTSGSTGKPKGVAVSQSGLSNYVTWAAQTYAADQGDGAPLLCSIGFDAAVTSLYAPLVSGKPTVFLQGENEIQALQQLADTQEKYSFLKLTPAHLEVLNRYRELQDTSNRELARFLVIGGEALPPRLLQPWLEETDTVAFNEYGPTETVVGCCVFRVNQLAGSSVPIGIPIRGTRLYVLDEHQNPVLPGMRGELCIGGSGVAQGYVNRPAATAAGFMPDPFASSADNPGCRMYRSGDLVRLRQDGNLEFLGRVDTQCKLHGFRIEPGEVEAALLEHESIAQAAVILHANASGGPGLVAFIACDSASPVDEQLARSWVRERLPAHMVPARVMLLETLPLTSHGKVDRSSLQHIQLSVPEALPDTCSRNPPRSGVERRIAEVWSRLLARNDFGTRDNFFDLGGSSLTILEAHQQLSDVLPANCEVIELFRHPTIAGLARFASGDSQVGVKPRSSARTRAERQLDARRRRAR